MSRFDLSRRSFIKQCVVGGVAVYSAPMLFNAGKANAAMISAELMEQWKGTGKPKFRLDGVAKVTGQKIYGRDYRAMDMDGWPDTQHYGFILRANKADHRFEGIDLSAIAESAKPSLVITSATLKDAGIKLPAFFGDKMLLVKGQTPDYLGHAVALLIFNNFAAFKAAKTRLQFSDSAVIYGEKTPLTSDSKDPLASWRIVRAEGQDGANGVDNYSTLSDGLFFPDYVDHQAVWPTEGDKSGSTAQRAIYYADKMAQQMDEEDWFIFEQDYQTQSIEPMMMEPEAFNGWFDRASGTLHTVLTIQSPHDFYLQAGEMIEHSQYKGQITKLVVHSPFIGGGFGAKDHTIFPYYGLMASLLTDQPVHIANDRFEQFQAGLKRHPFKMHHKLGIDRKTLKFKALISDMVIDGGGRLNFTGSVTMVGASALQGVYYLPQNDITAVAHASQNPDCGSMRGYGTLQSMSSMEMMVNESAEKLNVDPFKLRLANIMQSGYRNTQGAVPNGALRYQEMLELAQKHDIWVNREQKKHQFEANNPGKKYGVGFGIVTKDYGTGANAPSTQVSITKEGKIVVRLASMEMGTGTDTSQGTLVQQYLGNMADDVFLGEVTLWDVMQLKETDSPYLISQDKQDEMQQDPRWTPSIAMASSASQSSYFQSHTTSIAAKIVFEQGLWPAAVEIWQSQFLNSDHAPADFTDVNHAHWVDGKLTAAGYPPLSIDILAHKAHTMGLVTGVMVHAFNRWSWAESEFVIEGQSKKLSIDALALQYGSGASESKQALMGKSGYHLLDRTRVNYPTTAMNNAMVTYYAPCATLCEIAVQEGSGEVQVLATHTWLECGRVIVEKLVEGQIEGGLVMGLGHVLHEYLPLGEEGAGNGTWNLNRYQVPLAKHVGVWNLTHTILPPLTKTDPTKGMAEVVMIPIVPAIVEAIYQAIGTRFYHLPISKKEIKKALS